MYVAGLTATGIVRSHNEDTIFFTANQVGPLPNLCVVADGMGGHNGGEVASAKSLEYFIEFINHPELSIDLTPEDIMQLLVSAANYANSKVFDHSLTSVELTGMGTTFTACVVFKNKLAVAHIGDSRIYVLTQEGISQITTDHTYVAEMVEAGHLTPAGAKTHPNRNQLTRVLGCPPPINVDGALHDLNEDSTILLCSDGLTDMLSDDEIFTIVSQNSQPTARVQALVDAANNHGGIDNISAIIIDVKGETN
ncbi:MAG: Stp1/IreP family PP2C-type Ser/Thr phosphatase [Defluviitaleaceae bacterium]|nr:Stp1/IreP family PP2C-type Ser/Thr phosphatase [Defluviitaleaceae bacterium]